MRHFFSIKTAFKQVSCLLTLTAVVGFGGTAPALAQLQFLPTPPDQGAPNGRQRGGATRGDCQAYRGLTALVPEVEGVVWSQTASDTPSFLFEVPAALTEDTPLEFVIQDSNDSYAFRKQLAVNAPAGIIEIPLPEGDANLSPGESYTWTLALYCDASRPSSSVSVSGTINRLTGSSVDVLTAELTPEEQLDFVRQYAADGLWHEATSLAFALYEAVPNNEDYRETLESLFEQAGFTNFSVSAPVSTL